MLNVVGPAGVKSNLNPIVHGHVAGVQQGVVFVDGVDHPFQVRNVRQHLMPLLNQTFSFVANKLERLSLF
jgi:hypothetical protein